MRAKPIERLWVGLGLLIFGLSIEPACAPPRQYREPDAATGAVDGPLDRGADVTTTGTGGTGIGTGSGGSTVTGTGGAGGATSAPGDAAAPPSSGGGTGGSGSGGGGSVADAGNSDLTPAPTKDAGAPATPPDAAVSDAGEPKSGQAGASCAQAADCLSGFCVDGVCCESACSGNCEACGEAGSKGRCVAVTGAPRAGRKACTGTAPCAGACDGMDRTSCTYPGSATSCRPGSCTNGVATVAASCDGKGACPVSQTVTCAPNTCAGDICSGGCSTAQPCAAGSYCAGGKCAPLKANGQMCAAGAECSSGNCADGVCCGSACTGACTACNLSGSAGTCSPVKSTTDDACKGTQTCDGTGACKKANGQTCSLAAECASGACVDGFCCGSASCGSCQACTGGGGTCVKISNAEDKDSCSGTSSCDAAGSCKKKTGQTCSAASECQSGNCIDGVCCGTACNGACEACNGASPGTCAPISGASKPGHAACSGSCQTGVCCAAGRMNCGGTCVDLQADAKNCGACGTTCNGTCSAGKCCPAGQTNCSGTCVDLTSDDKHCGACSGTGTDCTQQSNIANAKICRDSRCKTVDGIACSNDSECVSGKCNVFYLDSDRDGYPSLTSVQRFCTAPSSQGATLNYIAFRSDGKSDCCDDSSAIHPGANEYVAWPTNTCSLALVGDTNCDGRLELEPTQTFTAACDNSSGTCQPVPRVLTADDCGKSLDGCSCSDSCVLGCFVAARVKCR